MKRPPTTAMTPPQWPQLFGTSLRMATGVFSTVRSSIPTALALTTTPFERQLRMVMRESVSPQIH